MSWKARRYDYKTRHHMTPKSRKKGWDTPDNLLVLWWSKHEAWHKLFGNRTIEEVRDILDRIIRAKGRP